MTARPRAVFTHLARTGLFLDALQEECLAPFGVSFSDYAVLRILQDAPEDEPLSPTRLADLVVRTTGGMTKVIDRLEREGLVRRSPDPHDGRGVLVTLTAKGRRTSDRAAASYATGRDRILERLSPDEVVRIDASLRRLLEVFEQDRGDQA